MDGNIKRVAQDSTFEWVEMKNDKIRGGRHCLIRDLGNHLPPFMLYLEPFIEMKMILHLRATSFIQETVPHYMLHFPPTCKYNPFSLQQMSDLIKPPTRITMSSPWGAFERHDESDDRDFGAKHTLI